MSACKGHFKSRSGKQWQGIFVSGEIIFSVTGEKAQEHLLQNNVCVCSCARVSMCVCMCVCLRLEETERIKRVPPGFLYTVILRL